MRARRRFRDSRGVTVVEYSLILAVFVFVSIGALKSLNTRSGQYYNSASNNIGDLPQQNIDLTDEDTIPSSTSSTTTSTTSAPTTTTTTTTTTPTTTSTTTTTTTPTTTSTTTTTLPLRSTINWLVDLSTGQSGSWTASARVKIVSNRTGLAVNGASVTIRLAASNPSIYSDRSCTTDSTGRCTVTYSGIPYAYSPGTATVRSVTSNPTWDGNQTSVVIAP